MGTGVDADDWMHISGDYCYAEDEGIRSVR